MSGRRAQTLPAQMLDEKPARGKCLTGVCIIWKVLTCLVSHITLVLLVVCYCVGGAYLFQHLEKPHEIEVKKGIQNIRYGLTDRIWKFSDNTSVLSESDWMSNVEKDLISFEKQILTAMKSDGWDGDEDITKTQWTFAGSLFYSIIVITTIGYGHISPHTDWGKVTTIFYAIMGIPLMLLCLSNIGDVMATSFRFIYWRVCCYVCTRKSRPRHRSRQRTLQPYRYSGHRSQPPSLRRSTRRRAYDPYEMDSQQLPHGLSHAHSDPELRHLARRDFEISRQELRDSKRSKHADNYERDYQYDARRCPWDCPCHREHAESRHHRRMPTSRYSTRSERWTHSMMYEEEFEQDRQPRYSYSLPRGRHSSRRLRAKTVDPRYSEYRQCPYSPRPQPQPQPQPHSHHLHYDRHPYNRSSPAPMRHSLKSQVSTHETPKISHCQHHQAQEGAYEDQVTNERPRERVRKTPIITKGYTIEELPQEDCNAGPGVKKKLRSHSMPRATHLHPRDALYIPVDEEETGRRLRRSRAMSVMPRHSSGYSRGVENYELNDLRSHASYKNMECTDCCVHERNDYRYIPEPQEKVMVPPTRGSYNSHTSYQGRQINSYDYGHRRSRKAVRHDRAEKLPPSPRIMSPMGFAVKRQTRQRPSFEYDEDSLNGWHENYDEMTVKNRPVPIWLCVFLVISYILGGAALFAYWEQWSFLDSAYFCFITLTTIGFGDFVPAKGVKDESEQSIAYCSLYLLFGIALLAMSFNLVQEEFIANVKEVARRLGIIKDEEDENE